MCACVCVCVCVCMCMHVHMCMCMCNRMCMVHTVRVVCVMWPGRSGAEAWRLSSCFNSQVTVRSQSGHSQVNGQVTVRSWFFTQNLKIKKNQRETVGAY